MPESVLSDSALLDSVADDVVGYKETEDSIQLETYPFIDSVRKRHPITLMPGKQEKQQLIQRLNKLLARNPPHLINKPANKRVLLLINPFSGQKRAERIWEEHGKEVLVSAGIEVDTILTKYPRHATEIMQNLEVDNYDAVLVNSGDGLVSEVICGLLRRSDRERTLKFPICHIPGGTSNALAAALLFVSNEPFDTRDVFIKQCAIMATVPRYIPIHLFRVDTSSDGSRSMFMSACWGLIADIDIGSERFRWAGLARLHVEAILRILQLPSTSTYPARVSYIPIEDKARSKKIRTHHDAERSKFGEGHFDLKTVEPASSTESSLSSSWDSLGDASDDCGSPLFHIPPLNEPVGPEWVTMESTYVMVNVIALSHIGSDIPLVPSARLGEDIVYLVLLDWATIKSRFDVADLFIRMNRSVHLDYKCFQIIPARAVRIEPLQEDGYFAIDGEAYKRGSAFQVVPTNLAATVIGRKEVRR